MELLFTINAIGLMMALVYITHLRRTNAEMCSEQRSIAGNLREQIDLYEDLVFSYEICTEQLYAELEEARAEASKYAQTLEAVSATADEYSSTLQEIDNRLMTDPLQFIHNIKTHVVSCFFILFTRISKSRY